MEDIENLSNVELKKSLEAFGYSSGPVTTTTRSVYEKKLVKLMAAAEKEVVQTKQTFSQEVLANESIERVTRAIEVVDYPFRKETYSTPRSYIPDGSNLTRRPLGTPQRNTTKVTSISTKTSSTTTSNVKKSTGFLSYCKYLLPVFILIVLLVILVYYHMEDGALKKLSKS